MEITLKRFHSEMSFDPDYLQLGFRRVEIFDFLKRTQGLNLEPKAAQPATAPTAPERQFPEWTYLRKGIRRFTLSQAAEVLSGLDPMHRGFISDEVRFDVDAVSTALEQALEDGDLSVAGTTEEYGKQVFTFAAQDLKQWADHHGYRWPIPLPPALSKATNQPAPAPDVVAALTNAPAPSPALAAVQAPTEPAPDGTATPANRWPWGNHHTKALGHLEAAAARWWVRYDPTDQTTAPRNDEVSEWLQKEHGASKNIGDAIASILRLDGLPTGPRR